MEVKERKTEEGLKKRKGKIEKEVKVGVGKGERGGDDWKRDEAIQRGNGKRKEGRGGEEKPKGEEKNVKKKESQANEIAKKKKQRTQN